MKNRLKLVVSYLIAGTITCTFILQILDLDELFQITKSLEYIQILYLILLTILLNTLNGFITNKIILKSFNINLEFHKWFGLTFINSMANYILPAKSGTIIKAMYLKKHYGLDISSSGSILICVTLISLATLLLLTIIIFSSVKFHFSPQITEIWLNNLPEHFIDATIVGLCILLIAITILITASVKFNIQSPTTQRLLGNRVFSILCLVQNGFITIIKNPRLIVLISCTSIANISVNLFILRAAYQAIGQSTDLFGLTCINLISTTSFFISVFPGNLVIQEILITYSSTIMNIDKELGFVAASLIRLAALGVTFSIGAFYYIKLDINRIFRNSHNPVA